MIRAVLDRLYAGAMPHAHAASLTRRDYAYYDDRCTKHSLGRPSSPAAAVVLDRLHHQGYYVAEGYWDHPKCEAAIREIDRILREYPQFIHPAPKSDQRVFGANTLSSLIAEFGGDRVLAEVATLHNRMPTRLGMTLAARLPATASNLGSGEGWHRDQFFRATKAMLYLTDVDADKGPFQMIGASAGVEDVCRDIVRARLGHMQYRIREAQVQKLIAEESDRLKTFCASAGTLIVFNASSIHRGKPIAAGVRYALTNYYFTVEWSDEEIKKHFAPVAAAA